jgi:hypothetical protein
MSRSLVTSGAPARAACAVISRSNGSRVHACPRDRGKRAVGIEVKASNCYRPEEAATLRKFLDRKRLGPVYVVYEGENALKDRGVHILPVVEFMRRLAGGEVIAP